MDKRIKISDAEMEVMRVIWSSADWMRVSEVCTALQARNWNYKTVGTFLIRLQEKGALETKKDGRVNLYRAALTEEAYKQAETAEFLQAVHSGSMKSLLAALYGGGADSETLNRLEDWLNGR